MYRKDIQPLALICVVGGLTPQNKGNVGRKLLDQIDLKRISCIHAMHAISLKRTS